MFTLLASKTQPEAYAIYDAAGATVIDNIAQIKDAKAICHDLNAYFADTGKIVAALTGLTNLPRDLYNALTNLVEWCDNIEEENWRAPLDDMEKARQALKEYSVRRSTVEDMGGKSPGRQALEKYYASWHQDQGEPHDSDLSQ